MSIVVCFRVCDAEMKLLLLLAMMLMISSGLVRASTDRCPTGLPSTSAVRVFRGSCYQFVSEERYWTAARDYCIQVRPWTARRAFRLTEH